MKQQLAPYAMFLAYIVAGVILVVGLTLIAARALSQEAFDWFWERI